MCWNRHSHTRDRIFCDECDAGDGRGVHAPYLRRSEKLMRLGASGWYRGFLFSVDNEVLTMIRDAHRPRIYGGYGYRIYGPVPVPSEPQPSPLRYGLRYGFSPYYPYRDTALRPYIRLQYGCLVGAIELARNSPCNVPFLS